VERSLGLMCGAGVLPARMAQEARRRGWRVLAFTFDENVTAVDGAERVVACRVTEVGMALATLEAEGISAVLFSGRFSLPEVLRAGPGADALFQSFEARANSRSAPAFVDAIISILGARGIEVLDQREFLGDWLVGTGCWSARTPTEDEWRDARAGLRAARLIAQAWIGQTVVVRHGAVVAVEAVEGDDPDGAPRRVAGGAGGGRREGGGCRPRLSIRRASRRPGDARGRRGRRRGGGRDRGGAGHALRSGRGLAHRRCRRHRGHRPRR
jgi:DUF1009 family protein